MIIFLNNYLNSKKLICLCVIGKEENAYVKEYINHYKKLGFQHIYIYDNNEIDGEKFENEINEEIKNGFVSIINYRGFKGIQLEAYYDCYKNNNRKYEWLSFFDFDEYLELVPKNKTIKQFLNNKIFSTCQSIKINWLMFSDNDLINYENKPVQERFSAKLNFSKAIKSIVRGNLKINFWEKANNIHSSFYGFQSCNPSGKIISINSRFSEYVEGNFAFLKHYNTKTIEEYINKIKKGSANIFPGTVNVESLFRHFFRINKKTKEKLDIIKQKLNYTFKL